MEKPKITIQAVIKAPIAKVWDCWTSPQHITKWNQASEDWHSPSATNDLRAGGRFLVRMEAKDGSMGFDFGGTYDVVTLHDRIVYTLDDGRTVDINFTANGDQTQITETFEAEESNSLEMQKNGWQSILDNFRIYTEAY